MNSTAHISIFSEFLPLVILSLSKIFCTVQSCPITNLNLMLRRDLSDLSGQFTIAK